MKKNELQTRKRKPKNANKADNNNNNNNIVDLKNMSNRKIVKEVLHDYTTPNTPLQYDCIVNSVTNNELILMQPIMPYISYGKYF